MIEYSHTGEVFNIEYRLVADLKWNFLNPESILSCTDTGLRIDLSLSYFKLTCVDSMLDNFVIY